MLSTPGIRALRHILLRPAHLGHRRAFQHPRGKRRVRSQLVHRQFYSRGQVIEEQRVRIAYRVLRSHHPSPAVKLAVYLLAIVPEYAAGGLLEIAVRGAIAGEAL